MATVTVTTSKLQSACLEELKSDDSPPGPVGCALVVTGIQQLPCAYCTDRQARMYEES